MKKLTVVIAPRAWNPGEPPSAPVASTPFQAYRADDVDREINKLRAAVQDRLAPVGYLSQAIAMLLEAFPQLVEGQMLPPACGKPYQAFIDANFTDAELVKIGFMTEVWK